MFWAHKICFQILWSTLCFQFYAKSVTDSILYISRWWIYILEPVSVTIFIGIAVCIFRFKSKWYKNYIYQQIVYLNMYFQSLHIFKYMRYHSVLCICMYVKKLIHNVILSLSDAQCVQSYCERAISVAYSLI